MKKTPLAHLRLDAFLDADPKLSIFINADDLGTDRVVICQRLAEDHIPHYTLALNEAPKDEILATLHAAIKILKQLPADGTLHDIAAAMGASLADLTA